MSEQTGCGGKQTAHEPLVICEYILEMAPLFQKTQPRHEHKLLVRRAPQITWTNSDKRQRRCSCRSQSEYWTDCSGARWAPGAQEPAGASGCHTFLFIPFFKEQNNNLSDSADRSMQRWKLQHPLLRDASIAVHGPHTLQMGPDELADTEQETLSLPTHYGGSGYHRNRHLCLRTFRLYLSSPSVFLKLASLSFPNNSSLQVMAHVTLNPNWCSTDGEKTAKLMLSLE